MQSVSTSSNTEDIRIESEGNTDDSVANPIIFFVRLSKTTENICQDARRFEPHISIKRNHCADNLCTVIQCKS